jgi:catalase
MTEQSRTTQESAHATPAAIVDALKEMAGNPPRVRASFAKGQCVRGIYTPSAQAADITRSASFTQASRVFGRFSVGGGNPAVADTNKLVLRGFSFRLQGDGDDTNLLLESAPVHFARTLDQMLTFLKARVPGADGKPDPEKVKAFSEANPETLNQAKFVAARPLPGSFIGTTYWGVHAFPATNGKGEVRFIKFKVAPVDGEVTLTDEEAKDKPAGFLVVDLEKRIAGGTARFHVLAVLDRPGDPTMDVTIRWPDEDSRETVVLGTIDITSLEQDASCDETVFDPSILADGIGIPPDGIFAARSAAYRVSFAKRHS